MSRRFNSVVRRARSWSFQRSAVSVQLLEERGEQALQLGFAQAEIIEAAYHRADDAIEKLIQKLAA